MIKEMHYAQDAQGLVLAVARKKEALPKIKGAKIVTVALSKGQMVMAEEGFPPELFRTTEQRQAWWDANPPKAMNWAAETQRRSEELRELRAKMAPAPEVVAPVKKKEIPRAEPIDTDANYYDNNRMKWLPRPGYKPESKKEKAAGAVLKKLVTATTNKKAAGKIDVKAIKEQFGVKEDSFREKLLVALVTNKDKITSIEDLAKAVYGSKKKASACVMVIKGLLMTIEKHDLPWVIDKSDNGYQLFEG